jgi:hypothetical protein
VFPFPNVVGIDVSAGEQSNIAVSRTFFKKLPAPYSDCMPDLNAQTAQRNQLIETLYNDFALTSYTQVYCMKVCYQNYIIGMCFSFIILFIYHYLQFFNILGILGCYDFEAPVSNITSAIHSGCWGTEQIEELNRFNTEFYNSDEVDKCYSLCPFECNRVVYDLEVTSASYPSPWYHLQDTLVDRNTSLMINVYYQNMYYTLIEDTPKLTINILVSIIGGNLLLLMGMSFLSFVEVFEFCTYILFIIFKDKRRKIIKKTKW